MDKIISLEDKYKNGVMRHFSSICKELEKEGINVDVKEEQFKVIIDDFYNYYQRKSILFSFVETMNAHLEDMMIDAVDEGCNFNVEFVLEELKLYELLDSLLAVNPSDTKRIIKKLYKKVGDIDDGGERSKKL